MIRMSRSTVTIAGGDNLRMIAARLTMQLRLTFRGKNGPCPQVRFLTAT